jgi:hypothetical protein
MILEMNNTRIMPDEYNFTVQERHMNEQKRSKGYGTLSKWKDVSYHGSFLLAVQSLMDHEIRIAKSVKDIYHMYSTILEVVGDEKEVEKV